MGAATGVAAIGAPRAGAATGAGSEPPGVPTVRAGGANQAAIVQALPALNSGWSYRTFPYHAFVPRVSAGLNVGIGSTAGMVVTAGSATFYATLDLPQGAVIHEAAFECYNTSSNTGLGVGVATTTLASSSVGGYFAFSTAGGGKHTVVVTPSPPLVVDNTTTGYALTSFLQPPDTQFGFFGARVAWSNGLQLTMLPAPVRKLDTRQPGPLTGKIVAGQVKTVRLGPELISGAKAALLNVTVTGTESFGFLTLYGAGQPVPGTSTVNWATSNETIANGATAGVGDGSLAVLGGGAAGSKAHVILDLLGYYS